MVVSSILDITLVTLQNCPSSPSFTSDVFSRIAEAGVNIDMISQAPAHGDLTSLSFTIMDDDLGRILSFISELKISSPVKTIISSGNCKINIHDIAMKNTPGVASKAFTAVAEAKTDLRLITTSDVDISILVTPADFQETLELIEKAVG